MTKCKSQRYQGADTANHTRRDFLKKTGIASAAYSLLPSCATAGRAERPGRRKPNIIFILAHDLFAADALEFLDKNKETPEDIDGISMLPTLLGKPEKQKKHKYLYWEFHEQGKRQAVRIGNWKGIRQNVAKKPDGPIELYNLKDDIGEKINIAKDNPKIVKKIEKIMKSARTPSQHWEMP